MVLIKIGQEVYLPDGEIGMIVKQLPVGEYQIRTPAGELYDQFWFPEDLGEVHTAGGQANNMAQREEK